MTQKFETRATQQTDRSNNSFASDATKNSRNEEQSRK